jgi:RHS repeat-associated protein
MIRRTFRTRHGHTAHGTAPRRGVATYAYDKAGNQHSNRVNSVETTYTANTLNQYSQLSVPSVSSVVNLSYDSDGNLLTNGVFSYTYDAENRLLSASSNGTLLVSSEYDYRHRRVRKTTPQATHDFVYDSWNLVQETIAATNGSVSEIQYFWDNDLSGTLQGAGGVGGLLAVSIDGQYHLPCQDANGNVTEYIDESGTVVAQYTYDAFGSTIGQSGSLADIFRFRFSTKYHDPETGFYYYGRRFYDPPRGRWLNRDPIEEDGGLNLYAFCRNDGVNAVDVLGMEWSIERNGLGTAEASCDCDSIVNLAKEIGLSVADYKKWISSADGEELPISPYMTLDNRKFRIPNTIYAYWAGDAGWIGKTWVNWESNISYLRSLGFQVTEYSHERKWAKKIHRILENAAFGKHLHGLYYWGHGWAPYPSAGLTNLNCDDIVYYSDMFIGDVIRPGIRLPYKMALGLVYACDSNSGRSALSSGMSGSIWHGYTGTLYPIFPFGHEVNKHIKHGDQGTR